MKKCKLPDRPITNVGFKFDAKELSAILKKVDSVTKFSQSNDKLTHIHLICSYKSNVFVIGRTPDTFVAHLVPNAIADGDTVFNIDPAQIDGLIAKRSSMTAMYTGREVEMQEVKGRYSSKFKVRPISPEQIPMVNEGLRHHLSGGNEMSQEVIDKMVEGVRLCRIKDTITQASVICRIECEGKNMRVASVSNWASSKYVTKLEDKVDSFRFSLSVEMFDLVMKFCGKNKISFFADTNSFAAEAEDFVLTLPPIQSTDQDYQYIDVMENAMGKALMSLKIKGDMSAPFENIYTLVDVKANTRVNVSVEKKTMHIGFDNDSGSVRDSLILESAVERPFESQFDIRILREMLRNIGREKEHLLGFHGTLKKFKAMSLYYQLKDCQLTYYGFIPA
ncbi:hypothetical protein JA13_159 [Dickeya phage vB_DsoM_JA13]|uniref:Uncharacterized protein n=1 Tax=Dickeya phage vB_DsoM_JA13 TaxID=2283030 RepID=A0A384ZWE8_9CAUD|nr:hypothetical protein JA13_159 [Dickeya phage vB_DsoM_JA13]